MKNFLIPLIFLMFSQAAISQEFSNYEGVIHTTNGQILSYKIVYKIVNKNTIEGYSLTDIEGEKLTKSWIKGQYDPSKKTISFKETGNSFTKTGDKESTFCFVTSDNIKIKKIKGKTVIIGKFKGIYPSGKIGAEGNLFLVESNSKKEIKLEANSAKPKVLKKTSNTTKKEIKSENLANKDSAGIIQTIKTLSEDQKIVLMSNEKLLVGCSKDELSLDIWDGAYVDGDRISIYLNKKILLENYLLTETRKTINLSSQPASFKLKIVALNTGSRGGNSVTFEVKDKNGEKQFLSKLDSGESFEIEFHVK